MQTWADTWIDSNGVTWTYTLSGGEATITASSQTSGVLAIPSAVNGYPVVSIGADAFRGCSSLTSVTIPEGVTSIGYCAFSGCTGLTSVTLPSSLTNIGAEAFYGCTGLTGLIIPAGMQYIEDYAFDACEGLTNIWVEADECQLQPTGFSDTTYEEAMLIVPEGRLSFYENDRYWGQFQNIVESGNLVVLVDDIAYQLNSDNTATVVHDDYADMSRVRIPATFVYSRKTFTVTSIAERAFSGCTELSVVALPATLTSIGDYAFADCPPYLQVYSHNPTPPTVNSNAFPENTLAAGKTLWVLDGNLSAYQEADVWKDFDRILETTDIGAFKIQLNDDLTATIVKIAPISVTELEIPEKFMYMDGYQETWYTITGLGSWLCVSGLPSPSSVILPSTLTTIGEGAFCGCSNLTEIIIPENVTSIGASAFLNCPLTSVTCMNPTPPAISNYTFYCYDTATLYVPEGSLEAYQTDNVWGQFNNIESTSYTVTVDGITYQLNSDNTATVVHDDYADMSRVRIPATFVYSRKTFTVTSIAERAFSGCTELSVVALPATLTSIGDYAFADCPPYLQVYSHNPTPPTVNSNAFPENTLAAGKTLWVLDGNLSAYQEADVWKDFDRILETTDIGAFKIQLNDDLTATIVKIAPISVTELEIPEKFMYMDGYQETWYTITGLGSWLCVSGLPSPSSVVLPSTLTTIETGAFFGCTNLTSIIIPQDVETIADMAFYNCPLTSVTCLNPIPPTIGSSTFSCYDTATLYVPEGSLEAYQNSLGWQDFLRIKEIYLGDVDGDSEVDVADFTVLAKYLLGIPTEGFNPLAADVAGSTTGGPDGEIDIADLTGIANIILHSSNVSGAPRRAATTKVTHP